MTTVKKKIKKKIIIIHCYYMASSASGLDEPNRALWLATRAGKMEPSCPLLTTRCIPQAKFHQKPYNKSFIDQVCSVKMAGYWPRSFLASLCTGFGIVSVRREAPEWLNWVVIKEQLHPIRLLGELKKVTLFRFLSDANNCEVVLINTQKKNLANIQPSWPNKLGQ